MNTWCKLESNPEVGVDFGDKHFLQFGVLQSITKYNVIAYAPNTK